MVAKPKTPTMQLVEQSHGVDIETLLSTLYHDHGLTMFEIAQRLGVTESTVSKWMERFRIPARRGQLSRTGS